MPVIKSAKKKLRQDKKREKRNNLSRILLAKSLKKARKNPTAGTVSSAVKLLDKMVKKHLIHKNRAARLKSSLTKLVKPKTQEKKPAKKGKK